MKPPAPVSPTGVILPGVLNRPPAAGRGFSHRGHLARWAGVRGVRLCLFRVTLIKFTFISTPLLPPSGLCPSQTAPCSHLGTDGDQRRDSSGVGTVEVGDHSSSVDESQLASHAAFLDQSCNALQGQCESSAARLVDRTSRVEQLTFGAKRLEDEIGAMQGTVRAHENSELDDSAEGGKKQTGIALEHRSAVDEYAALQRTRAEHHEELEKVQRWKTEKLEASTERLTALKSRLVAERQARPSVQLQGFETKLQETLRAYNQIWVVITNQRYP